MSYSNTCIEEIHSLQEKLQDAVKPISFSEVLTISEEIDTLISVKV